MANLRELSARLARMGHRPQPERRTCVDKTGSTTTRPPGISTVEAKTVEEAGRPVLEPFGEPFFRDDNYRPRRDVRQCADPLGRTVQ